MKVINRPEDMPPLRLFLIFSILSALYILSMFYRVSNAVIAPDLVRELGLNAETLGILGGAFFYSFALLQVPMGPMLDRIGPRRIVASFSLIGGLGALLFASGGSFVTVFFGRILIGMGMACILMRAMKVFVLTFPREIFNIGGFYLYWYGGNVLQVSSGLPDHCHRMEKRFLHCRGLTIVLAFWFSGSWEKKKRRVVLFLLHPNRQ
jgi:MFS family permease